MSVRGSGLRAWGLGSNEARNLMFLGMRVQDSGFRFQGLGEFRIQGLGCRLKVWGLGRRVSEPDSSEIVCVCVRERVCARERECV